MADCDLAVRLCEGAQLRSMQGTAMLIRARTHERMSSFVEAVSDYTTAVRYLEASPERYDYILALVLLATILDRIGKSDGEVVLCVQRAERAAKEIKSERLAAIALLHVCQVMHGMRTPDTPGIARNASMARRLADACDDMDLEARARAFLSYAGQSVVE
jgi:hypothetical protein